MTIVAEFDRAETVVAAAAHLHDVGYRNARAITPFPLPELDEALGIERSRLPYVVFAAGLLGVSVAFLIIWWTNAIDYPLDVGGRPLNSVVTDIPIMFETMVLFAAITAFTSCFLKSGMPRLWHPWFEVSGIERTNVDRYWLGIDCTESVYEPGIVDAMRRLGAVDVRDVEVRP